MISSFYAPAGINVANNIGMKSDVSLGIYQFVTHIEYNA